MFRAITTVQLGDGHSTLFWDEVWLPTWCLTEAYPALHSHCVDLGVFMQVMASTGIDQFLCPHLSRVAEEELHEVTTLLDTITLLPQEDKRLNPFLSEFGKLQTTPSTKLS
jgi:hypothetical protein